MSDIFVKDLVTGAITRVSTNASGAQAANLSRNPVFSPDGTKVAFASFANNLVAGDTNGTQDIFVKDLVTGAVTRVSTSAAGAQSNNYSIDAAFSPDGTKLVFTSNAGNLVAGDTNGVPDIFIKDLATEPSRAFPPMPRACRATVSAGRPCSPPTAPRSCSKAFPTISSRGTRTASMTSSSRT